MRARWVAAPVVVVALVFALWLAWAWSAGVLGYAPLWIEPTSGNSGSAAGWPWHGAVHVHTVASGDASGSLQEIAAAARTAGLDYVVVSDHAAAGVAGSRRGEWVDGILIVHAEEISTYGGHLLALGARSHRYALGPGPGQAIRDIEALGGAAIVAHPAGGETAWTAPLGGVAGFEIPNLAGSLYRLQAGPWTAQASALLRYVASPQAALLAALEAPDPTLERWDSLTARSQAGPARRLHIVGGVDAHGPRVLGVPPYAVAMAGVVTTVWLEQPPGEVAGERARSLATQVTDALVAGRSAVTLGAAGRAPGFAYWVESEELIAPAGRGGPGSIVVAGGENRFRVRMGAPGPYRIELVRDGEPVAAIDGDNLDYRTTEPGTYRVQVFRTSGPSGAGTVGTLPWILTNPIYVWTARDIVASQRFPVPPLPPLAPATSLLQEPGWAAESDATSMSALAPLESGLRWEMRIPREAAPDVHSAVAWRPEGSVDWAAYRGLTLQLASADEWRVALQLRTAAPAGGERIWERVVRAGPDASSVVFWPAFQQLGPGDEGAVEGTLTADDLSAVTSLALVVTPFRMRPGVETTIDVITLGPVAAPEP